MDWWFSAFSWNEQKCVVKEVVWRPLLSAQSHPGNLLYLTSPLVPPQALSVMATTVSQGPLTSQTPALFLINQGALYVQMFSHATYSVFQRNLRRILEYRVDRVTTRSPHATSQTQSPSLKIDNLRRSSGLLYHHRAPWLVLQNTNLSALHQNTKSTKLCYMYKFYVNIYDNMGQYFSPSAKIGLRQLIKVNFKNQYTQFAVTLFD